MDDRWEAENAGQRFDEVVDRAQVRGPQFVVADGVEIAVVIDVVEYERLTSPVRG